MLQRGATLLLWFFTSAAFAQAPPVQPTMQPTASLHVSYDTYAAAMHVAKVDAGVSFGPRTYQVNLGYHTTGLAGFFVRGHQFDVVSGNWHGLKVEPLRYVGEGTWRGVDRLAEIDYQDGKPIIRQLIPPINQEREPVPDGLKSNTVDSLSALAELIRVVDSTGRCEAVARTYDGRRAVEIEAHTAGDEVLEPTSRSSFAGRALRCDFSGRMLAGFLFDEDRERGRSPMHGSAWLAPIAAGAPRMPVRMTFETRWFGEATMYLIAVGPGSDVRVAQGN